MDFAYIPVKHCLGVSTANAARVSRFGAHSTHVKHSLGASTNRAPANVAPVNGLGANLRETLSWRKYQGSVCKTDFAYTPVKHGTCQRIRRTLTCYTAVAQDCLQIPHLSADLAYAHVKHCLGASANKFALAPKQCFRSSTNRLSANAAPVSGFGVHPRETLWWHKYHGSICTCCTCQRIWRTPT